MAEKLNHFDIAENLYRRYADLPNNGEGKRLLALFLGRRGRLKDGLDLIEPLWANPRDAETVATACIVMVASSNATPDPVQIDRVTRWLEQAIKVRKESILLPIGLGNCRERQGRYDEAKALYQSVIKQVTGNAVVPSIANNRLMIAMSYNNLAWLMALKDDQGKDALLDINRAIDLMGPQPDYLDTRGVIHLALKQTQDALNDLENAVKADPAPAKLFHLAQAYFQANNKEKAKQYMKEAKAKGLDQGLGSLHSLERPAYQKLLSDLGV